MINKQSICDQITRQQTLIHFSDEEEALARRGIIAGLVFALHVSLEGPDFLALMTELEIGSLELAEIFDTFKTENEQSLD